MAKQPQQSCSVMRRGSSAIACALSWTSCGPTSLSQLWLSWLLRPILSPQLPSTGKLFRPGHKGSGSKLLRFISWMLWPFLLVVAWVMGLVGGLSFFAGGWEASSLSLTSADHCRSWSNVWVEHWGWGSSDWIWFVFCFFSIPPQCWPSACLTWVKLRFRRTWLS